MRLPVNRRTATIGLAVGAIVAVAVALGNPASAGLQREGTIRDAGTAEVVADTFVVTLGSAPDVDTSARALVARYGGQVAHVYRSALHGFAVHMTEAQAKRLAADPSVVSVQRDGIYHLTGTQANPPSYGLDRLDQRNLPLDHSYTFPTTASGVHAYIIDTGIRITHQTFGGRASVGVDEVTPSTGGIDCNGHGTHVAGTVGGNEFGVAKGVSLVAVRVLDCGGSGDTAGVAAGIDWVTQNSIKPAVANMSLGGGPDATLDAAVRNSIASGVTYGIAAGNSNANACGGSPSDVTQAIVVGASDMNDNRASFSNFGTCVDIFAPGVAITSSWMDSDTATNTISGTSMATPHVVGAAALILAQHAGFTPAQVESQMIADSTANKVVNPGTGSPNRLLFVPNNAPPANDFSVAVSPGSATVTAGGSATTTVSTAVTSGSAQPVSLSATGLPAGASASFNPASVTAGGSSILTVATSASTPAGTFPVKVTGSGGGGTSHSATFTLTVTAPGGTGCTVTHAPNPPTAIPDANTTGITDAITVTGCNRAASATAQVTVHITHTYRGDLRIELIAPDGTVRRIKSENGADSADNVNQTFTVNLSSEAANGKWQLHVTDRFAVDTGVLNSWTLAL
jgi:subtilisin family serine protease